jgi:hypothetical protein
VTECSIFAAEFGHEEFDHQRAAAKVWRESQSIPCNQDGGPSLAYEFSGHSKDATAECGAGDVAL